MNGRKSSIHRYDMKTGNYEEKIRMQDIGNALEKISNLILFQYRLL